MNGFVIWMAVLAATLVPLVYAVWRFSDVAWVGIGVVCIALLSVAIAGAMRWGTLAGATQHCAQYHNATGRETKLVDTGPIDWTCFALVDGHWYPLEQIYSERPAP